MAEERTERFTLRMTPSELAMASALADADGVSVADAFRLALRRLYAERFGEKKPKPKRK